MLKEIVTKGYNLLSFQPFVEYLGQLDQLDLVLVSHEEKNGFNELIFSSCEEKIQLLIYKDNEKEWGTINKYKEEGYNYEQIEFLTFNENLRNMGVEYNRVIKYSAHFDNEKFSKIANSVYSYLDNEFVSGWTEKRKIDIADIEKIVSSGMNLTELVGRAEEKRLDFYEAISLTEKEVKELKLVY